MSVSNASVTSKPLTPEQVLKARMLLGWTRERLAARNEVSVRFISKFESLGKAIAMVARERGFDGLSAVRAALEAEGVRFGDELEPCVSLAPLEFDHRGQSFTVWIVCSSERWGWSYTLRGDGFARHSGEVDRSREEAVIVAKEHAKAFIERAQQTADVVGADLV